MNADARRSFFWSFAPGLIPLTALYVFLTAFRDFRDNFQRQLFDELGIREASAFAQTEAVSAFAVLVVLAAIYAIRGNRRAVLLIHGVMLAGMLLLLGSTLAWQRGARLGDQLRVFCETSETQPTLAKRIATFSFSMCCSTRLPTTHRIT